MKPNTDKTTQHLKEEFDKLGEVETQSNKRDVREARRRLKHAMHKRERNNGKQQLRHMLDGDDDGS